MTLWKKELTIIPNLQGALPAREFKLNRNQHPFLVFDLPDYDLISIYDLSKSSHLRILVWMVIFSLTMFVGLGRPICTPSSPNKTLETLIIRVQYSCETIEWDSENVFDELLDNDFPFLKTLTIMITAYDGRDVTSWVNCIKKIQICQRASQAGY